MAHPAIIDMMTMIRKTIDISVDRKLYLDIPQDMPAGPAELIIRSLGNTVPKDDFDEFFGCFKGHELWEGDSVKIVREIRDEW
jgi:hypothetical protein